MRFSLTIFLFLLSLLACQPAKDRIKPAINKICFAAGSCFGSCPVFAVEIDSDLTYKYYGANFVETKGFYVGKVKREYWDSLVSQFSQVNYLEPDTSQLVLPSDGPSLELILCFGKEQWRIDQYNSSSELLRSSLHQLRSSFDLVKPQRSRDTALFHFLTTAQGRQDPIGGIKDVMNDKEGQTFNVICIGKEGSGGPAIRFSQYNMTYYFPGFNYIQYKIKLEANKIIMYWDINGDFKKIPELLETFGLSKGPKFDQPFAEFSLVNDSIVKTNYLFPEWVQKINSLEEDTLFPNTFMIKDF